MNILSIQSHVVYGHVGNGAAVLPLQRLGHEVWAVPTVLYSNHPGHGGFRGEAVPPETISGLVEGLEARGFLGRCDAVLSGYLRTAAAGAAALDAVARVRRANDDALWCCDPVLGDADVGVYVDADLPRFMAHRAMPQADILTPNTFELGLLTDSKVHDRAGAMAACAGLRKRMRPAGPRIVLCTSLTTAGDDGKGEGEGGSDGDGDSGTIATLVACDDGVFRIATPRLANAPRGAGDMLAAIFLGRYLLDGDAAGAAGLAVSSVFAILAASVAAGSDEPLLVAAQDQVTAPGRLFEAERIG